MNKWLSAAALALALPFGASAVENDPALGTPEDIAAVNRYYEGENCNETPVPHELPFEEGKTPPRPCRGYFWTLVTKPAVFKCVSEQVPVSEATFYLRPTPPKYEWVEERVMVAPPRKVPYNQPAKFNKDLKKVVVQEAYTDYVVTAAEWEDVCETITFRPAMEKEIPVPAQYKTEILTIEVEPERDVLCGMQTPNDLELNSGEKVAGSIGMTHKPARCVTIPVQKVVVPESTRKIKVPAITKTVMVRKLKKPASVQEIKVPAVEQEIPVENCVGEECIKFKEIPAEYKQLRRLILKSPAGTERVEVPAQFRTFNRNQIVEPMKMLWRQYSIRKCKAVADSVARYGCLPASGPCQRDGK
ncbi:MAG: hypothetical protein LBP75_06775 [Planctomycetota bacterium]|nr:hypothetical protein [Planctomycetota bacterium]